MTVDHLSDHAKNAIDALSIGIVLGTLVQLLPTLAAAASLLWTTIRVVEWAIPKVQNVISWVKRKTRDSG